MGTVEKENPLIRGLFLAAVHIDYYDLSWRPIDSVDPARIPALRWL